MDAKPNKKYNCELCGSNQMLQRHHKFSNTILNRRMYGSALEDPKNIMILCEKCHLWKTIPKYSEIEFCKQLGIKPRSKIGAGYERHG